MTSAPSDADVKRPWWPRVGVAIVIVIVPLMLLAPALPPLTGPGAYWKQTWVLRLATATAVASAIAYFVPSALFPRKRGTLPLIVFGTAVLLIANIMWNRSFLDYTRHHTYVREVFRRAMRNFHAPVYGRYDNAIARNKEARPPYSYRTLPWVIVTSIAALGWFYWALRRPLEKRWDAASFAVLCGFMLAMIALFALCEPPEKPGRWAPMRFTLQLSGYSEFASDIPAFKGVRDTLRNYVDKMPPEKKLLNWYGQHYPPGNLILLTIEKQIGIPGLTKAVVCLLTALTAVPLYLLAKELELDDMAASAAVLLFAMTTGVLVYATLNTTSMVMFPGTMCLWLLVRSLKTGSIAAAALLGLSFTFYLFFSFSASILGVLMALMSVLGWWSGAFKLRSVLVTGAVSLACVFASIGLLYLTTRFNLIACFITAVRGHQEQQGNEGFDDARRWWLRSTGNVIAYLLSIVPLCILAVAAVASFRLAKPRAEGERLKRSFFVATMLTVLIAGFSGLFYVETERIWIFLTPAFALAAGYELRRRAVDEGRRLIYIVLFLVIAISCTQEFFFQHYR
jgi:hypothetical protein